MALALYRKYRPASFAEVVGQEHVTDPLRTALAAGRINHAYLFSGPRGCGKTSSARILARSLNCVQGPTPDPCGVCPSCIALAPEGPGSLDVVELDAASHGGVDDTRELRDRAFYMPAESRYRVFIIDEAHMVTTQGFNALLKIVEEPPEHLVFIFATTEPDKVLTTIRSRTHHYPFRLIPPATLRALLERLCAQEQVIVDPTVFPLVIQAGGGSARDSLSVLDQLLAGAGPEGVTYRSAVALLGVTDTALLDETVDALAASDGASVFGAVDKVVEAGHDPRRFAADLLQRLRDLLILAAVPDAGPKGLLDAPSDQLTAMAGQADRLGIATLTRLAEILHSGLVDMRGTTSPRLLLELLCARMLLPAASLSDGGLLQRLERLERRFDIAADGADQGSSTDRPAASAPAAPGTAGTRPPVMGSAPGRRVQSPVAAGPPVAGEPTGSESSAARPPAPASREARTSSPPAAGPAEDDLGLPLPPELSSRGPRSVPTPPAAVPPAAVPPVAVPPAATPPPGSPSRWGGVRSATGPAGSTADPDRPSLSRRPEGTDARDDHRAAPPTAPAGGPPTPDVTDVRRLWAEILDRVQRQRRSTRILLADATVAAVSGGVLQLNMPSAGLAKRVVEPANADLIRAALKDLLGVDWRIRCDGPGSDPGPAASPGGGGPGRALGSAGAAAMSPEPPDEDIPDDYGDEPDPSVPAARVRDPQDVAIELLTAQLGARPLDPLV